LDKDVVPGVLRTHSVGVGHYRAAPAEDCDYLLGRLCSWLAEPTPGQESIPEPALAILKAILAHLYLAWIHPFGDGNGRTARLAEFQLLVSAGVPTPAAHLLSNHYNETRTEYYRQLDYTSRSGGDVFQFLVYALRGFVDGLREQTNTIRTQQWDVSWTNYVHEEFANKKSASDHRRKNLVLDMSSAGVALPLSDVDQVSPRTTKSYAQLTKRALIRDLNELQHMGLVEKDQNGKWLARKNTILAFLPIRKKTS